MLQGKTSNTMGTLRSGFRSGMKKLGEMRKGMKRPALRSRLGEPDLRRSLQNYA